MLVINTLQFNLFVENCHIAWDRESKKALIVDPGCFTLEEKQRLFGFIETKGLKPEAIFITHGHLDHIAGVRDCQDRYGIPAYISEDDRAVLKEHSAQGARLGLKMNGDGPLEEEDWFKASPVSDGQILSFAGTQWRIITTPGHSPGGVCFYSEAGKILFTGDTLFKGTIGRSDLFGGDYDRLILSVMEKIMGLDGSVAVYPGHGEATTISDERTHNPFLEPFNEPEEINWDAEGIELDGQA